MPDLLLIIQFLDNYKPSESLCSDISSLFSILETFKLNEEIVSRCLPILCAFSNYYCYSDINTIKDIITDINVSDALVSGLKHYLNFYAAAENNENLRHIAIEGLKCLDPGLFAQVPEAVLSLLLDDVEDIRGTTCQILHQSQEEIPVNPAETLANFVKLIGLDRFSRFLDEYETTCSAANNDSDDTKLFEKEALNLFIDTNYLRKKYFGPTDQ